MAADSGGTVYVAWHGRTADAPDGEEGRRFWISRSRDDGATFTSEEPVTSWKSGAVRAAVPEALVDSREPPYVLYRGTTDKINRDMILLQV